MIVVNSTDFARKPSFVKVLVKLGMHYIYNIDYVHCYSSS